ncbi:MAG TPA: hypothetical protein VM491_22815 [Burkholderiaceae bacterium]|nr:hypothetical protein [Burkholderiaceae bacterium]
MLSIPRERMHQIFNTGTGPAETIAAFAGTPVGVWLPDGSPLALPWRS